ncbi:MAG: hypothetical protein L3J31_02550 [Bacteroidales bacterium]|nr:hypothetical protein [Bacteroidales bacterium]
MRSFNKQGILFVTVMFIAALLFSCSTERKFATAFVDNSRQRAALVFFPDFIFKTNQKTFILDSLGITDESLFDSALLDHSKYLKQLNDSLFMANYIFGFTKELSSFGFTVFREGQLVDFMEVDTNAFVINVAQIELEESIYTHHDEAAIYDTYYFHDQDLEAVYVNAWIEISKVNENSDKPNVYFATGMIADDMEGEFTYDIFTGNINYVYNIDSLEPARLYEGAFQLGRTYAGYTFDYLLNNYLDKNVPAKERTDKYWRFDPYNKSFFPATDDRLVPLDE